MHLPAAPDVAGDGFAFGLRHRAVHRNHKFAVRRQRIDIFFLKEDADAKLPEDARIVDAVERVAGKSLDGLCKDEVNLFSVCTDGSSAGTSVRFFVDVPVMPSSAKKCQPLSIPLLDMILSV